MKFAVLAALALATSLTYAGPADQLRCESALERASILRYFRQNGNFEETRDGIWTRDNGRLVFISNSGAVINGAPILNSASHLEIIRRQIGDARLNQILSSSTPDDDLSKLMADIALAAENPENVREAEEILEETESYPAAQPLPELLEKQILTLLKTMERLASPLAEWLKPKVLNGRLNQLLPGTFDNKEMERRIGPTVRIYKASLVNVLLSKPRQFIISSGRYAQPDMYHAVAQEVLNKMIPKARFFNRRDAIPGYILVYGENESFLKGRIEFVRKGDLTVERSENYDFTSQ